MAIPRTPIVDDSGTGTDGTVINNAWKQELYDQIDTIVVGTVAPPQTPAGGTINDLVVANTVGTLTIAPTATAVYTGFAMAGVKDGQRLLVENLGPSPLRIAHEDAGSAAANRVSYGPSTRGQWLGVGGAVVLVYSTTASRWRMLLSQPGAPINQPYNAAEFTANNGNWTVEAGDVAINAFVQEGALLSWTFRFATTSVQNAGAVLRGTLPGGFTVAVPLLLPGTRVSDNGAASAMAVATFGAPTSAQVNFYATIAAGNWAASVNLSDVQGVFRFQIQ